MKKYILGIATVALTSFILYPKSRNNVCKTFSDYYSNRDTNENCYYNPDSELKVPEVIERHGYPVETYEVVTKDGYILSVFRIPHGKESKQLPLGIPVLLLHGVNSNSGCFVNMGVKSLAFILADSGYDVWLGNLRGSKYSLNHIQLNHEFDSEFWNFSIHEYGAYDLPALLKLAQSITKQKVIYLGYSLGTTAMYIYSSIYPETARDQVKLFINLAPCVFFGEETFSWVKLSAIFLSFFKPFLKIIDTSVVASGFFISNEILRYACLPFPFQMKLCVLPHVLALGSSYEHLDPETLPITLIHNNDKCPLKVWIHLNQLWNNNNFAQYDHGEDNNLKVYGYKKPLEYNLTNLMVPMYFIRAPSDLLCTEKDVNKLYNAIPVNSRPRNIHVVQEEKFAHFELLTAKDVVPLVHNQILKVLEDDNRNV